MKRLRHALPLMLFVLLAAVLARGLALDPRQTPPSPLVGKAAPAFVLPRLDDPSRTLRRDDLRGDAWLLNVWASWCTACLQEHAVLVEFSQEHRVPLIGLNHKDQRGPAIAWLERHGNPYRLSLFDADGRTGIDFGVRGVPETFVIDRHGVIRWRHAGPLTANLLREQVLPLIEELDGA